VRNPRRLLPDRSEDEVLGDLSRELVVAEPSPELLARRVVELLARGDRQELRQRCSEAMRVFDYQHTAERLVRLYESVL
jgi:hypothetical protein